MSECTYRAVMGILAGLMLRPSVDGLIRALLRSCDRLFGRDR